MWHGELDLQSYWRSLKNTRAESVFSLQDPLPSLAEILMIPYLAKKKYVKSKGNPQTQSADDRGSDVPETESVK